MTASWTRLYPARASIESCLDTERHSLFCWPSRASSSPWRSDSPRTPCPRIRSACPRSPSAQATRSRRPRRRTTQRALGRSAAGPPRIVVRYARVASAGSAGRRRSARLHRARRHLHLHPRHRPSRPRRRTVPAMTAARDVGAAAARTTPARTTPGTRDPTTPGPATRAGRRRRTTRTTTARRWRAVSAIQRRELRGYFLHFWLNGTVCVSPVVK